ncbi:hypothetical protein [Burkholderia ambifaria]|uniref:hypothetical protein n=1 Tax=Burkholderia ambifaria TaxID=152480 RepID=UPI00158C98C6|nr:hypothetical protein [Burkholderia ambifaria]
MNADNFADFVRRVEALDLGESSGKTTAHTSAVTLSWAPILDSVTGQGVSAEAQRSDLDN